MNPEERVADVRCSDDSLIVDLMDGRTISVSLAWYPRLHRATKGKRAHRESLAAAMASTDPNRRGLSTEACSEVRPHWKQLRSENRRTRTGRRAWPQTGTDGGL